MAKAKAMETAAPPANGGHERAAYSSAGDIQAIAAGLRGRDIKLTLEEVAALTEDDRIAIVGWLDQQRGMPAPQCLKQLLEKPADQAAEPASARSKKPFQVAVEFGNVGIGEGTARLGIKIDRTSLAGGLHDADRYFGGRRLHGRVLIAPKGELPGQAHLFDGDERQISSVFDVKGFAVSAKALSCGLTFALEEIDVGELAHFAKQSGWLQVETVSALDDDEESESDGPTLFDREREEQTHPDLIGGTDRPVGTPALEAAAKVHKEKAESAAPDNLAAADPPAKKRGRKKAAEAAESGVARAGRSIDLLDIPDKWKTQLRDVGIPTIAALDDEIAAGWPTIGRKFSATVKGDIEKQRLNLPPDHGRKAPPPADDEPVPVVPDHDAAIEDDF